MKNKLKSNNKNLNIHFLHIYPQLYARIFQLGCKSVSQHCCATMHLPPLSYRHCHTNHLLPHRSPLSVTPACSVYFMQIRLSVRRCAHQTASSKRNSKCAYIMPPLLHSRRFALQQKLIRTTETKQLCTSIYLCVCMCVYFHL